jgi:hypothetical protein
MTFFLVDLKRLPARFLFVLFRVDFLFRKVVYLRAGGLNNTADFYDLQISGYWRTKHRVAIIQR